MSLFIASAEGFWRHRHKVQHGRRGTRSSSGFGLCRLWRAHFGDKLQYVYKRRVVLYNESKWTVSKPPKRDIINMPHFNGYHSTTESFAVQICKTNHFIESKGDRQWLGYGVYFFVDPAWVEWWWGIKKFPDNDRGCVECSIDVLQEFLWNIDSEEGQKRLELAYDLAEAYSAKVGRLVEITEGAAINHLATKDGIQVVIGEFSIVHEKRWKSKLLRRRQIQISVRDEECISGIRMYTP